MDWPDKLGAIIIAAIPALDFVSPFVVGLAAIGIGISVVATYALVVIGSLPKLRREVDLARIVVWGLGRDEIEGRELAAAGRSNLERYWQQILVRFGFKEDHILLGYEYPDLSRSDWAKESALCPKVQTNK